MAVPQKFLNRLDVNSIFQKQTSCRVAQVMEPNDGKTGSFQNLFELVRNIIWVKGFPVSYELDGNRVKTIQTVNAARKQAIADGMTMEQAMEAITDETVGK